MAELDRPQMAIQYVPSSMSEDVNDALYICWGHAVAQLVEALRYKSEGRGFDSR